MRNALPLAPERAAQHVHHRVAVRTAPLRDLRQEDRPLRNLPALFPTPDERSLHRTRGFDHPVQPVGDGGRRERAQRPLSPRMHVDARAGLLAEPGRGILLQDDPPDAALISGSRARTSPRRGPCATSGRRTPGRAGGGTRRTWAQRPRDPSWTPSFRMGRTRQVSCWTLWQSTYRAPRQGKSRHHGSTTGLGPPMAPPS